MTDLDCHDCRGEKLNEAARYVTVGGVRLPEVSRCSVHDALGLVKAWNPKGEGPPEAFQDILEALDDRVILCRMLGNLLNIYHGGSDSRRMNRVAAMLKLLQDPRD